VLVPDGGEGAATPMDQRFTSWNAIYRTLRSAFAPERYHMGSTLVRIDQAPGRVVAQLSGRGAVEADLLVCADGSQGQSRRRLLPDVNPRYAGYVAWRGTLEESSAPPALAGSFDGSFTLCEARSGGHILCYLIPGSGASTRAGERWLNWVWYVNVPDGAGLARLLTDRTGRRQGASVPPGMVSAELVAELREAAARELHARFAELVVSTPDPFIQSIQDVAVPQMAFARACLVGDAAFLLRPHPGAATAKAASDASALAAAVAAAPGDLDAALAAWQGRQLDHGRALLALAVELGTRSVQRRDGRAAPTLADSVDRLRGIPSA
jgi:2-polyprenyl-6-methoxyphenol hydroxylase-like FAD-dependent oxidoreductase